MVSTAKQLCTAIQLSKSWREALTHQELERLWERFVREEYPRVAAILSLRAVEVVPSWRDVYREQRRVEAATAVNFTNVRPSLTRALLSSFIFTVELRLDRELKASWTGKGPAFRIDEFNVPGRVRNVDGSWTWGDRDNIIGEGRLWTSPPDWYCQFVEQPRAPGDPPLDWGDRLELTLFVSRMTPSGLRTGKLCSTSESVIDGFETGWIPKLPNEAESGFHIEPLMFAERDTMCGRIDFGIEDNRTDTRERVGSALARMIGQALYPGLQGDAPSCEADKGNVQRLKALGAVV